jgi:hypothetical protein
MDFAKAEASRILPTGSYFEIRYQHQPQHKAQGLSWATGIICVFFQKGMTQFSEDPAAVDGFSQDLAPGKYTLRTRVEVME